VVMDHPHAADWEFWLDAVDVTDVDVSRGLRFNSGDMVIQAALIGQGLGMARTSLAALDLKAGNLVRPFAQSVASNGAYYLVYPEDHLKRPRVLAFVSWLKNEVAATLKDIDEDGTGPVA
jgi:LysR family transcriptional regulator, glycine cleavage system transcriptional activator